MQRIVALKRMPQERRGTASDEASFLREAMITAKLDHPNIIPIHDMGRDQNDLIFYTMRRVRGRPWSESLASLPDPLLPDPLLKREPSSLFARSKTHDTVQALVFEVHEA